MPHGAPSPPPPRAAYNGHAAAAALLLEKGVDPMHCVRDSGCVVLDGVWPFVTELVGKHVAIISLVCYGTAQKNVTHLKIGEEVRELQRAVVVFNKKFLNG